MDNLLPPDFMGSSRTCHGLVERRTLTVGITINIAALLFLGGRVRDSSQMRCDQIVISSRQM